MLLLDADAIRLTAEPHYSSREVEPILDAIVVSGFTYEGHEFAAAVSDERKWKRLRTKHGSRFVDMALGAVIQVAVGVATGAG